MAKPLRQPATYDDLLRVPDHLIAEIVEGELYGSPRPAGPHERAMGAVFKWIGLLFDDGEGGPGGWWIAVEPEVHIGADVFVPDVAGWKRERVPEYLGGTAWEMAPDWVCEVLSPKTARLDRVVKLPRYAQHAIPWAWIVDPSMQTLEVYRLEQGRWVLISTHEGNDVIHAEPFGTVDFPLGRLWVNPPAA